MDSSRYTRMVCSLFLALVMLLVLCGTVLAHGTSLAVKSGLERRARPHGPAIGQAVAVGRPKRPLSGLPSSRPPALWR